MACLCNDCSPASVWQLTVYYRTLCCTLLPLGNEMCWNVFTYMCWNVCIVMCQYKWLVNTFCRAIQTWKIKVLRQEFVNSPFFCQNKTCSNLSIHHHLEPTTYKQPRNCQFMASSVSLWHVYRAKQGSAACPDLPAAMDGAGLRCWRNCCFWSTEHSSWENPPSSMIFRLWTFLNMTCWELRSNFITADRARSDFDLCP